MESWKINTNPLPYNSSSLNRLPSSWGTTPENWFDLRFLFEVREKEVKKGENLEMSMRK